MQVTDLYTSLQDRYNDFMQQWFEFRKISMNSVSIEDLLLYQAEICELEAEIGTLQLQVDFLVNYLIKNSQSLSADGFARKSKYWLKEMDRLKWSLRDTQKAATNLILSVNGRMKYARS